MEVNAGFKANNNVGVVSNSSKNRVRCMPNYNALQADTVSFSGKKQKANGEVQRKSNFVHKSLVSLTGCFIPGLGQALNGQWGKAALFAFGAPLATVAAMSVSLPLAMAVGAVAEIGMFVDAYRNA